jgi:hypothetical protein
MYLNETYSKVRISKPLSGTFPIQNGLKQGGALSPFLFYADDVNLLGGIVDAIKKNFDASNEVGLEVNAEKSKYMLPSHHQNAEQNQDITIANRSFENVAQL